MLFVGDLVTQADPSCTFSGLCVLQPSGLQFTNSALRRPGPSRPDESTGLLEIFGPRLFSGVSSSLWITRPMISAGGGLSCASFRRDRREGAGP